MEKELMDLSFPLISAALLCFLPVGTILLMSSAMPEDKAPATAINLMMVWGVAALAYFGVGFAFQFGGIAQVSPNPDLSGLYWEWYPLDQSVAVEIARLWGLVAFKGWALTGEAATPGALLLFLSHVSLAGLAAFPLAVVLIQRGRNLMAVFSGLLSATLLYPVAGNWLWGGGWLAHLGSSLQLGHGLIDFGGATVIFLAGSGVALMALLLFKPDSPSAQVSEAVAEPPLLSRPMPSAYLPILSMLGAGFTLIGWFGLSTAVHLPTALNYIPAQAAANGLLAALAGALAAAAYSWFTSGAFNSLMTARGLVAGLIIAAAGAPFIPLWQMVLAGLGMGLLLPLLIYLLEQRFPLADHLGIVPTYGFSALIGVLLVGFLADGRAGQGWNGTGLTDYIGVAGQGVSGLVVMPGLASDWPGQLQAQFLGASAILGWALLLSFLYLQLLKGIAAARARRTSVERAPAPPEIMSETLDLNEEIAPDSSVNL